MDHSCSEECYFSTAQPVPMGISTLHVWLCSGPVPKGRHPHSTLQKWQQYPNGIDATFHSVSSSPRSTEFNIYRLTDEYSDQAKPSIHLPNPEWMLYKNEKWEDILPLWCACGRRPTCLEGAFSVPPSAQSPGSGPPGDGPPCRSPLGRIRRSGLAAQRPPRACRRWCRCSVPIEGRFSIEALQHPPVGIVLRDPDMSASKRKPAGHLGLRATAS